MPDERAPKGDKFFYFVDGAKYDSESSTVTGAQIKARLPNFDPTFGLFLENPGDEPDQPITDETSVSLEKEKGPRRFYTAPPMTFGRR